MGSCRPRDRLRRGGPPRSSQLFVQPERSRLGSICFPSRIMNDVEAESALPNGSAPRAAAQSALVGKPSTLVPEAEPLVAGALGALPWAVPGAVGSLLLGLGAWWWKKRKSGGPKPPAKQKKKKSPPPLDLYADWL